MAVNNSSENSIVEVRDEQMVDPTCFHDNPNPTRRTAHFLKPSLNPNTAPPSPPKTLSFSVTSRPTIKYLSYSHPLQGWQTWVQDLEATHGPLWRKAGIFDAIKASTYHITRNSELLFRLAERWCPETNTFVFPWGEATLTLEDVFVLAGFSPLGESVLKVTPLGDNVKQVEKKLIESHRELANSNRVVSVLRWQKHFMGCGNEIEHAGFLALWLTRHVFPPRSVGIVTQVVLSVAARLSCGIKFDLASPVLASIYKDLTLLKRKIFGSNVCTLRLGSQLQFVQVWAWERFPSLGPVPRMINLGETRLSCWDSRSRKTCRDIEDIGISLDSARDTFRWRPYAMSLENWSAPRFYADLETWVIVDSDEEWKIIARFLVVCQLTGLDCVEGYNPNRVALQFGYDQDIPKYIDSCEPGSLEYEKNLNGLKLYIPHRLREGDVTYRYSNWWNGLNLVSKPIVGCKRKTRTKKRVKKLSKIYKGGDDFVALDMGARDSETPAVNLQSIEDVSSQHLVQDGVVNEMTFVLNMLSELSLEEGTSMEEERRNEARRNKFPHSKAGSGEFNKYSNAGTSQTQPMTSAETLIEHESNILRSKAAETEKNLDSNQGADCMKLSRVLKREKVGDPDCGQRHLHFVNGVARASVTSPLIRREGGSEKFQHNTGGQDKEQIFIRQDVVIGESSEYLEQTDKARNETSTECNISLIGVASEVNAMSLILENNEPDKADIQVDVQVGVISVEENIDLNPFAALCRDYESRISELEREISALSAVNVTSSLV